MASLAWNNSINEKQGQQLLIKKAASNLNMMEAFRVWGTRHEGVYAPVTEDTQPNPFLSHVPERDIAAPSGKKLTLLNPAYMTRQLMNEYEGLHSIKGKITALVLMRPDNAPDDWEKQALHKLKAGAETVTETSTIDGVPHLRMMRPLFMEPGCEKCHSSLGFKTGDFRGGVSVSVPATPYIEASQDALGSLVVAHVIGWLFGMTGIVLTGRQIRQQIQMDIVTEKDLRRSERTLSDILRISPSALLTTKSDGTITQFNEGAINIFGYELDEIIGRPVSTLIPEAFRARHGRYFKDFEEAENTVLKMDDRAGIYGRRRDGTTFPAAASVSKLRVGREIFFTIALHDLTEQAQKEAEILEARDLAEVASRSKSEFLANMSHEIRTPLTATKGMLELIDTANLSDSDCNHIQIARDASDAVIVILNDILDLARLEAGRTELEVTTIELRKFVNDVCHLMRDSVVQKGLNFQSDFPGSSPIWIKTDVQRLRQILINLIGNATKFTERGEISLAVKIQQGMADNSLHIEFQVRDTGIGIPEDELPRLFGRFEQQDSTLSRMHQGSGLGLSICKELAELMDGTIHATSEFGSGSSFFLQVTCDLAEASSTHLSDGPSAGSKIPPLHVLVAEDNIINQLLISEFLQRLGHTFEITSNGQECLQTFLASPSENPYDIILMDVQMPVLDGLEATQSIRSQSERPADIPIIALTADAMNQHQEKYTTIGMNGFIAKPYSLDELEAEMTRVMQEKYAQGSQNNRGADVAAS